MRINFFIRNEWSVKLFKRWEKGGESCLADIVRFHSHSPFNIARMETVKPGGHHDLRLSAFPMGR